MPNEKSAFVQRHRAVPEAIIFSKASRGTTRCLPSFTLSRRRTRNQCRTVERETRASCATSSTRRNRTSRVPSMPASIHPGRHLSVGGKKGGGLLSGWLVPAGDGCYPSRMVKERHGFDLAATSARLEDWWLDNVSFPVGGGITYWPGGRSESIRALLFEHWGQHGVNDLVEHEGGLYSALGCLDAPCPVLGIALALLEICAYEEALWELQEIKQLKQAAAIGSISESMRNELLALAGQLAMTSPSRAVENRTAGRPKRILGRAVAQQLKAGGFPHRQIAAFMASTADVTRHRCGAAEARSLSAVLFDVKRVDGSRRDLASQPIPTDRTSARPD